MHACAVGNGETNEKASGASEDEDSENGAQSCAVSFLAWAGMPTACTYVS